MNKKHSKSDRVIEQAKYVGYTRVSTAKQIEGNSLQYQTDGIKKYCEFNDIVLVKIYTDKGISAFKHRPAYVKALAHLFDEDITGFIVDDFTRFGRSTIDLLSTISKMTDANKNFVSIKNNINLDTKEGKLLLGILSSLAEYEATIIKERLEAGKEYARINGTKSGKPMHRPEIQINWDEVKKYRDRKLSWTATAKVLAISPATLISRAKKLGIYAD